MYFPENKILALALWLCAATCAAQNYHILSTNTDFMQMVYVTNAQTIEVEIKAPPSGSYWRTSFVIISNVVPRHSKALADFLAAFPKDALQFDEGFNQWAEQNPEDFARYAKWKMGSPYTLETRPPFQKFATNATFGIVNGQGITSKTNNGTIALEKDRADEEEVLKAVEQFIATNKTYIRWSTTNDPPWRVSVYSGDNMLTNMTVIENVIAIVPDHEPGCHLIRYVQDGHTNEFHAWQVSLEVTK